MRTWRFGHRRDDECVCMSRGHRVTLQLLMQDECMCECVRFFGDYRRVSEIQVD